MRKPKYRIVERDDSFYVQKRFLWSNCWYDVTTEDCGFHGEPLTLTLSFPTYKKARKYLDKVVLGQAATEQVLSYH